MQSGFSKPTEAAVYEYEDSMLLVSGTSRPPRTRYLDRGLNCVNYACKGKDSISKSAAILIIVQKEKNLPHPTH